MCVFVYFSVCHLQTNVSIVYIPSGICLFDLTQFLQEETRWWKKPLSFCTMWTIQHAKTPFSPHQHQWQYPVLWGRKNTRGLWLERCWWKNKIIPAAFGTAGQFCPGLQSQDKMLKLWWSGHVEGKKEQITRTSWSYWKLSRISL